jgi:SagB-type dehydrogenase family enzyme
MSHGPGFACVGLATVLYAAPAAESIADLPLRTAAGQTLIKLPAPVFTGTLTVEQALRQRRSVREYLPGAVTVEAVSQLLWAAQGITGPSGERTAPSAGALYPLQLYLVAGEVGSLARGIYAYRPSEHALERITEADARRELADAALGQAWMSAGAAVIVLAAAYDGAIRKYGTRGTRYVQMEVGHAAQNVYLEAASLGLGTVIVGAFDDERVAKILHLPSGERPLAIMPVGRSAVRVGTH